MEHLWIAIITTLAFVPWSSANKEVLYQTPNSNWFWEIIPKLHGWGSTASNAYTVCNLADNIPQPNNWLRSRPLIDVRGAQRVDVTVKYTINPPCSSIPSAAFCKDSFDVYVWESNISVTSDQIPDPITRNSSYRNFGTISGPTSVLKTSTIPLQVKSKYIVLGFHDQGGCKALHSVKVTYNVCPGTTLADSLVYLPRTSAPSNDLESIPVEGSCIADSVLVRGSLNVLCESSGEWNVSRLEGRCICKEDMENTGGTCTACSDGMYNEGKGRNCTVLPSHPRNVNVSFVNQSSAMITWQSPATTGGQVFYDVDCQKTCGKDCVEETCDGDVSYVNQGLNTTRVTITTLSSFVNYTCKIFAKNRVSEVAARKHRVYANFAIISFKTEGSVPDRPDVFVQDVEGTSIVLSWKLKCKNGIIQEYRVSYFRVDDTSNKETLTTKQIEIRIERLEPGKTFEFQVVAVNNFGTGPAGVKTFQIPTDNTGSNNGYTISIAVSTALGVVLLIVLVLQLLGLYVYRQSGRVFHSVGAATEYDLAPFKLKRGITRSRRLARWSVWCRKIAKARNRLVNRTVTELQAIEGRVNNGIEELNAGVVVETNTTHTANHAQYMDISDVHSFELERDDIRFGRLLGSGNFGEVFKATMGRETVAVKSLKESATAKDKLDMVTELNVMKGLKPHPHVLMLIGCCSLSNPLLIVLEYLPYGDLLGYLRKSRGHADSYNTGEKKPTSKLTAKDLLTFAWMIADGMKYLAKMKVVHRDLAARNILVGENEVCKISDFGLARDVNTDIYVRTSQARLPVKWMPPESLFRGESSTMSDVWSYGIVLWEVFTIGDSPYPGVKAREVASLLERGYRMMRPIHISQELFSILSECWSEKPEDRPTFQWICAAIKRLIKDQKTYLNLDVYNDKDYVNFDMVDELQ